MIIHAIQTGDWLGLAASLLLYILAGVGLGTAFYGFVWWRARRRRWGPGGKRSCELPLVLPFDGCADGRDDLLGCLIDEQPAMAGTAWDAVRARRDDRQGDQRRRTEERLMLSAEGAD